MDQRLALERSVQREHSGHGGRQRRTGAQWGRHRGRPVLHADASGRHRDDTATHATSAANSTPDSATDGPTATATATDGPAAADFSTFQRRETDGARNDLARLAGARMVSAVERATPGPARPRS